MNESQKNNGEEFMQRYAKLNAAQKTAVDSIDGPVLVVAGPGSGKTEILSLRVGNILKQTDVAPNNILCLTFTDSASINMRKRLGDIIGRDAYRVAIHTFHSFGTEVIDKNPEFFFNGARFIPADELSQLRIIESILSDLDHNNPLRSEHPEQGFVYAKPLIQAITHLKKAGLRPDEFRAIVEHNYAEQKYANPLIAAVFDERMSKDSIPKAQELVQKLSSYESEQFPVSYLKPWIPQVTQSLMRALEHAHELEKATPLSEWKTKNTKKDDNGARVHKDTINIEKMYALADVYERYRENMYTEGFYDFDDMLLETISALEKNDRLRFDLQEQFQYVLVDEFQDTNDAQIRLLRLITDAAVHEGRPNVMAVGDDDQAIYKFQGAEVSNILDFKGTYRDPEIVTMTENYRSTQDILDMARKIISKGEERLENMLPEIKKELIAKNPDISKGDIVHKQFETLVHEYVYVTNEIKRLMEQGKDPSDIAVISRNHKKLEEIVSYMHEASIAVNYERKQNVLNQPHIHQLITMGRYVSSLGRKNMEDADHLLPEILSYPFWQLERETIWGVAYLAEHHKSRKRVPWIKVMRESKDRRLKDIAAFFDELSGKAQTETLESVLDALVGAHMSLVADDEDQDEGERESMDETNTLQSPFRSFYFSFDEFESNKVTYLTFLSGLRVFMHALREYRSKEKIYLDDMIEFVDLHEKNHLQVTDKSPFTNAHNAVNVMTAHKAKGLEFDMVFVLSCQDDVWAAPARGGYLQFPENLAISPAGDTFDDQLKLFYVAVTRAKSDLYLTSYRAKDNGSESLPLHFLHGVHQPEIEESSDVETAEALAHSWETFHHPPLADNENALLQSLLEDYQMPVTHLNNFLDVSKGGPQIFLEQNLLRFPQSMTPAAAYGSSMHKVVELLYVSLRKDGLVPSLENVLEWFEQELSMQRLSDVEHKLYLKRGKDALTIFYNDRLDTFDPSHKIEVNFRDQGVVIGDAHLTGKIDKMIDVGAGVYEVVDFKTGHPVEKWQGKTPYEKVKLHNYKRQIIFYKLLVENSRDYMQKGMVNTGRLEFLEPKNKKIIDLPLDIQQEDVERTKKLIEVVYNKIMNLDFPDVSEYPKDVKGVIEFEDMLLQ